ncbi:MAG: ABC transporter permease, partial [Eubacterium sp.]|nr:ABC transporter permease [Eubacterium sp.]
MKRRNQSRSLTNFYNRFGIYIILIVLVMICAILSDSFLTMQNLMLFFRQNAIITIITCGTLVVLISGEMDFSQGAVAAFGGCIAVLLIHTGKNAVAAVAGGLFAGALLGLLNGIIVTKC